MTAAHSWVEHVEFAGVRIDAGHRVIPSRRDAYGVLRVFEDTDRLDPQCTNVSQTGAISWIRHISVGTGPHFCLGAGACIGAQDVLHPLLRRFPNFPADLDGVVDHQPTLFIRTLRSLSVDLGS